MCPSFCNRKGDWECGTMIVQCGHAMLHFQTEKLLWSTTPQIGSKPLPKRPGSFESTPWNSAVGVRFP